MTLLLTITCGRSELSTLFILLVSRLISCVAVVVPLVPLLRTFDYFADLSFQAELLKVFSDELTDTPGQTFYPGTHYSLPSPSLFCVLTLPFPR